MKKFPNYIQTEAKDCGPTCIKIISKYYSKTINTQQLRDLSETTREGSNLLLLSDAAEQVGFKTLGVKLTANRLKDATLPCILHWNKNHYVVFYKVKKNKYYISDPGIGLIEYSKEEFIKFWIGNNANENTQEGIALLLEPTNSFYEQNFKEDVKPTYGFKNFFKYTLKYKAFLFQVGFGLLAGSLLQLIFPFLTQSIVDVGIANKDINFIYLILIAQLVLFVSRTAIETIRSWILLHLSTRINVSIISDFFIKLMNLPISFFDVRMTGDIMQRIGDHKRVENILTTSSLNILFSTINAIIYSVVLVYYSIKIFAVFMIGSALYFGWITLFLKYRKNLDYKRFAEVSTQQSTVIELINGMQEIKLHNAEKQKRWGWEYTQARLFKISIKGLMLDQTQGIGSSFLNELKNILIIFLSAKEVIDGNITIGMMMAITTIVGSLNAPIMSLINFVKEVQDAKISLTRLAEIHDKEDEVQLDMHKSNKINSDADIILENISYKYPGTDEYVIKNLNLTIPANKVTAIVGTSGSGKTTLMKILLKFYEPQEGSIILGETPLNDIKSRAWRDHVGAVMQEGYIFNDTIANNIAIGKDQVDIDQLKYATDVANIQEFIENYALKYNTKIGMEGVGISTGQKQRLFIARAVYKNPNVLFLDEATSSLDANNEKEIMQKLDKFFKNKTVVVIAHRLSTVKNADQIVVLEKGQIVEIGTHKELTEQRNNYYQLVKNQLELGQ